MTHEEVLDEVNVIYERISNNENNLFSDGKYTEALEVLIDYYEVGLIDELEKIKQEFEEIKGTRMNIYTDQAESSVSMKELRKLFDKHIAELKGEQE